MMDFSDIALTTLQFVSPVLLAALAWLSAKAASLIQGKVSNEYLRGVLVRLDEAVTTAVKDLQQTVVDEIKRASADGKLTSEEKKRIKQSAIDHVKSYLGPKGVRILAEVLGLDDDGLGGFLAARVEAAVHDLRLTDRAVAAPEPVKARLPLPLVPALA
ncbi:hypothetical protein [Haliangium ochraceum]|nr:hypothetical protein [Haliangium ochraceum]